MVSINLIKVLESSGNVYVFGKNDEGQLGTYYFKMEVLEI
jgi:hypothetical protein